jgi:hypothetical protein
MQRCGAETGVCLGVTVFDLLHYNEESEKMQALVFELFFMLNFESGQSEHIRKVQRPPGS